MEKLISVKGSLLTKAKAAVLNQDDPSFSQLKYMVETNRVPYQTYRQALPAGQVGKAIAKRFEQSYNQWNAHLVWTMAQKIGVTESDFIQAINDFPGIKGRMEEILNDKKIRVIVDFAHTSNGLEQALTALQPQK